MDCLIRGNILGIVLISGCGLVLDPGPPRQDERSDSGVPVDSGVRDAGDRDGASSDASNDAGSLDGSTLDGGAVDGAPVDDGGVTLDGDVCPPSNLCGGRCVDVDTDPANCGICNNGCGAGETCGSGSCQAGWVDVATGLDHTCAMTSDGRIYCWGIGLEQTGVLGPSGSVEATQIFVANAAGPSVPLNIEPLGGRAAARDALAVGDTFSCAIGDRAAGAPRVLCWGDDVVAAQTPTAVPVPNTQGFINLSAGNGFVCSIKAGGTPNQFLECWGENTHGQLGTGPSSTVPVVIHSGLQMTSLGLGDEHGCFVEAGATRCWGKGEELQLGPDVSGDSATPAIPFTPPFVQTTGGLQHHCGLTADGRAMCWGGINATDPISGVDVTEDLYGRRRVNGDLNIPLELDTGELESYDIAVGDFHGCVAVRRVVSGTEFHDVLCWGKVPAVAASIGLPTVVPFGGEGLQTHLRGHRVLDLEAGNHHTCALFDDQSLYCWGDNDSAVLGCGPNVSGNSRNVCRVSVP